MRKVILISVVFIFLLIAGHIIAHQPRLVEESFTLIKNPEVSQAFYGELTGEPVFYRIESNEPFNLYVGILVPDIENIDKDLLVEISKDNEFYYLLDGVNFEWQSFHEEFANDDYFKGPELSTQAEPGTYTLKVFSPDNQGKYVLVVGEKEEFPFNELIKTIIVLPQLKTFFNKSPLTAYFNLIGLFILIFLLVVLGISILIFFLIKRIKK